MIAFAVATQVVVAPDVARSVHSLSDPNREAPAATSPRAPSGFREALKTAEGDEPSKPVTPAAGQPILPFIHWPVQKPTVPVEKPIKAPVVAPAADLETVEKPLPAVVPAQVQAIPVAATEPPGLHKAKKPVDGELKPEEGVRHAAVPFAPVELPVPAPVPLPVFQPMATAATPTELPVALTVPAKPVETALAESPAVQLTIKIAPPPVPGKPALVRPEPQSQPELKHETETPRPAAERVLPVAPVERRTPGDARQPEAMATVTPASNDTRAPEPSAAPASRPQTAHRADPPPQPVAVPREIVPPDPQPKPPLRTMSFELGRDGGEEVKIRLAERSGEVHVSVHSNDTTLNYQLREGIHDLATVLSNAGYDAQTFQGQGRGRQQQQPEQPGQGEAQLSHGENFDSLLEEVI